MDGHKGRTNIANKLVKDRTKKNLPNQSATVNQNLSQNSSSAQVNLITPMHKNTVQVMVNSTKTNALCDTGASISCVSKPFLNKALPSLSVLKPSPIKSIVGVGGEQHSVAGMFDLKINFDGLSVDFSFHVVESLHHTLILGIDFMEFHKVKLDIANKTMSIHSLHDTKVFSLLTNTGYARTSAPINLEPKCEVNLGIKISRCQNGDQVLIEPVPWLSKFQTQGAKCLVSVKKGKAVMRIMNPTEKVIALKGNQIIGMVTRLESSNIFAFSDDNLHVPKENSDPSKNMHNSSTEI